MFDNGFLVCGRFRLAAERIVLVALVALHHKLEARVGRRRGFTRSRRKAHHVGLTRRQRFRRQVLQRERLVGCPELRRARTRCRRGFRGGTRRRS